MGLTMNENKTKVMIADKKPNHPVVTNFNYLELHLTLAEAKIQRSDKNGLLDEP